MNTRTMRLIFRDTIGSLLFNRYQHERHGVIETLTQQSVVYVRPVFGLLKPDEPQQTGVAEFHKQKPQRRKQRQSHRSDVAAHSIRRDLTA